MNELVGKGRPFYSAMDTGAKALKRKVGTGAEFLKELMALPGVKPTELKERGLEELMSAPKMTHEQFLGQLARKPAPKINEKVLTEGGNDETIQELIDRDAREYANREIGTSPRMRDDWSETYDDFVENANQNKYLQYQKEADKLVRQGLADPAAAHSEYTLPGGENYREMLIKDPQGEFKGVYGHFHGEPNILASMRLKDRTGPNGEKLLHLEELQSDWHQKGREHGYKQNLTELPEGYKVVEKTSLAGLKDYIVLDENGKLFAAGLIPETATKNALDNLNNGNRVPNAPFKKNWDEMAIKRLIHHAAENGYHGIVVTPGQEQADRYQLSKRLKQLSILKNKNGKYFMRGYTHGQNTSDEAEIEHDDIPEDRLKDYIGHELAKKSIEQGGGHYRGLDLNTGGEGMKGFYDKKVPNIFNAVGKKHGVKMQLHGHPLHDIPPLPEDHEPEDVLSHAKMASTPLHHFPITKSLREDVLKNGLPLHKTGGVIHKAEGGNVQPSVEQMRMALQNKSTFPKYGIQSIGANEAPDLSPKYYIQPNRDGNLGVGGVDMDNITPGMQLVKQEIPNMNPPNSPNAPQAPQSPLGAPPSPQGGQSNILNLTPQGQALSAMTPPQTPQGLSGGGQPKKISKRQQTVKNAQRIAYPGIYGNPREIAELAASRVAPENPALKQLFGVTREDMYNLAKGRQGMPHLGMLPGAAAKAKGAASTEGIMNPRNEQRIIDVMAEAEKHKPLIHGMDPWYYMNPLFERMVQLLGLEKATHEYKKMNALMGMASSASEVNTEIPRGSAAYYMDKLGRFNEFVEHGGKRSPTRPHELGDIPGHLAHKTAHAVPMKKFLERGEVDMSSPKVPMYIEASGVPQTGFQTRTPVGDAHWSRAVGLADTRNPKTVKGVEVIPGASVTNPEMHDLGPWWRDKIAKQLGLESVPAQARAWGAFSPQTGVTTPIGAPKLEMIAGQIMNTAKRLGVSPETARDMVLTGKERMGFKKGGKVTDNLDTMRYALTKAKKAK